MSPCSHVNSGAVIPQRHKGFSQAYLASLHRLKMPYKIGLVQHGEWTAPSSLADDPDFKGYVVFLLNPEE